MGWGDPPFFYCFLKQSKQHSMPSPFISTKEDEVRLVFCFLTHLVCHQAYAKPLFCNQGHPVSLRNGLSVLRWGSMVRPCRAQTATELLPALAKNNRTGLFFNASPHLFPPKIMNEAVARFFCFNS